MTNKLSYSDSVELLQRFQSGEPEAWESLYKLIHSACTFVLRKTRQLGDEDLCQELALYGWEACKTLKLREDGRNLYSYLVLVLHRRACNVLRSRFAQRDAQAGAFDALTKRQRAQVNEPDKRLQAQELVEKLALNLSKRQRSCLRLFLAGNSYLEIADLLSMTPKQVDNDLARVRRCAKSILQQDI